MTALYLTPVVLSFLVLAAHFLRAGRFGLIAAVAVILALVTVRRPGAARAVQTALIVAALEWIRTLVVLARLRLETGQPAVRMAVILGCVALFTLLSSLVFFSRRLRERYRLEQKGAMP